MTHVPEPDDTMPSKVDPSGPVDYAQLKAEIAAHGPYIFGFTKWQVDLAINITPCGVEGCRCSEDVISITQSSGFTSLSTLITRTQIESHDSLSLDSSLKCDG